MRVRKIKTLAEPSSTLKVKKLIHILFKFQIIIAIFLPMNPLCPAEAEIIKKIIIILKSVQIRF